MLGLSQSTYIYTTKVIFFILEVNLRCLQKLQFFFVSTCLKFALDKCFHCVPNSSLIIIVFSLSLLKLLCTSTSIVVKSQCHSNCYLLDKVIILGFFLAPPPKLFHFWGSIILQFVYFSCLVFESCLNLWTRLFFFKVLFIYSWETQRERLAETQAEGEVGSMQRAPHGPWSRVSRITPWAEGGAKLLSHPSCPFPESLDVTSFVASLAPLRVLPCSQPPSAERPWIGAKHALTGRSSDPTPTDQSSGTQRRWKWRAGAPLNPRPV